ncbi:hypothetical protein UNPF46_29405 [Bradyrhizobium sp. UNPF46]|nr:hypothetical protein UNPF46_29405 [Bradyrhizobium sp. UNPF46]
MRVDTLSGTIASGIGICRPKQQEKEASHQDVDVRFCSCLPSIGTLSSDQGRSPDRQRLGSRSIGRMLTARCRVQNCRSVLGFKTFFECQSNRMERGWTSVESSYHCRALDLR